MENQNTALPLVFLDKIIYNFFKKKVSINKLDLNLKKRLFLVKLYRIFLENKNYSKSFFQHLNQDINYLHVKHFKEPLELLH